MMTFARVEKPCARNVDGEAHRRSGSLPKVDLHRRKDMAHGLLADPENDAAREPGEITQLPGPERETRIVGVLARIGVGAHGAWQRTGIAPAVRH